MRTVSLPSSDRPSMNRFHASTSGFTVSTTTSEWPPSSRTRSATQQRAAAAGTTSGGSRTCADYFTCNIPVSLRFSRLPPSQHFHQHFPIMHVSHMDITSTRPALPPIEQAAWMAARDSPTLAPGGALTTAVLAMTLWALSTSSVAWSSSSERPMDTYTHLTSGAAAVQASK